MPSRSRSPTFLTLVTTSCQSQRSLRQTSIPSSKTCPPASRLLRVSLMLVACGHGDVCVRVKRMVIWAQWWDGLLGTSLLRERKRVGETHNNFGRIKFSGNTVLYSNSSSFSSSRHRKWTYLWMEKQGHLLLYTEVPVFCARGWGQHWVCAKHDFGACRSYVVTRLVRVAGLFFKLCWWYGSVYPNAETQVLLFLGFCELLLMAYVQASVQRSTAEKKSISECYVM